ncbi:MAG: FecCD family ABC transporter permease [Phycisphaerae bacterium]
MSSHPAVTKGRLAAYGVGGSAIVLLVLLLCICLGPGKPGTREIAFGPASHAIMTLRLTRVGAAAIAGAALAAAGVLLQGLLKNPLADPYILGLASGAAVGVMGWIVLTEQVAGMAALTPWLLAISTYGTSLPALTGALAACGIVYFLARRAGALDPLTLLLGGVVISTMGGAAIMLLNNLVPYGARADIVSYLFGYISEGTPAVSIYIALAVTLAAWCMALATAGALNVASLSDTEAHSLGLRLNRMRTLWFIAASLLTAAAIAIAGPIGFVGLICPHICRSLFGPDHRQLLVTSPLAGATFLMLADTLVRCTGGWFNGQLPVGVVTALCGGPFFLYLLSRRPSWE